MDEFYNSDFVECEEECEYNGIIELDGKIYYV